MVSYLVSQKREVVVQTTMLSSSDTLMQGRADDSSGELDGWIQQSAACDRRIQLSADLSDFLSLRRALKYGRYRLPSF